VRFLTRLDRLTPRLFGQKRNFGSSVDFSLLCVVGVVFHLIVVGLSVQLLIIFFDVVVVEVFLILILIVVVRAARQRLETGAVKVRQPDFAGAGQADPSGQSAPTETRAAKSPVTSSDLPTFASPATTAIFPSARWSFHNHRTGCAATSAAIRTTARSIGRAFRPNGSAMVPSFPRPPSVVSGTNASTAIDARPS
jgi:hypothetical protein